MIEHLQRNLKDLVGRNKPEQVFRYLREEVLRAGCELYNQLILLEARHSKGTTESKLGLIDFKEGGLSFNNITHALLWLIDKIDTDDLKNSFRIPLEKRVHISKQHTFTCDRVAQNEQVQLNYYENMTPQIRHFYVHGDARQAVESLVQRLGNELSGRLLNWEDANYQPSQQFEFVKCKPAAANMPKLFLINLHRELLAKFGLDTQANILQRKLDELLHSPILQGRLDGRPFGKDDFVFILFTIDDYNWNERVTPEVVKEFVVNFCACQLPDDAPNFFIFYGISYSKENETVQKAVLRHIEQSAYGEKLDTLLPVKRSDVAAWFSQYDVMVPVGKTADDAARGLFPDQENIDMLDVQVQLQRITDQHNKGVLPDM